jgi:pyridoxal phosphate enzyme (YggS family)
LQPSLQSNLQSIRRRIGDAAVRAGRPADRVHLLAVTKSVPPETAAELVRLGQLDLGESRADELERKADALSGLGAALRWHFIGHLQRNKARRVVARADVIHSVDSIPLLATLDRLAAELGREPEIFLEVKLAPESEKSGLDPDELPAAIAAARDLRHVRLLGLMTMAPLVETSEPERVRAARRVFERLSTLAGTIDARAFRDERVQLSMGMSDDFEIAIAAGSDWVRIGTSLFAGLPAAGPSAPRAARATGLERGPGATIRGPLGRGPRVEEGP